VKDAPLEIFLPLDAVRRPRHGFQSFLSISSLRQDTHCPKLPPPNATKGRFDHPKQLLLLLAPLVQ